MLMVSNTWGRRGDASDSRTDARSCQVCHRASNVPAEQIFLKSLLDLRKKRQIFKLLLDRFTEQTVCPFWSASAPPGCWQGSLMGECDPKKQNISDRSWCL